jgi:hypothetical protein
MGGEVSITKLYQQILEFSFPESDDYSLNTFHHVLSTIILAKVPLHEDDLPRFILQSRSSVTSSANCHRSSPLEQTGGFALAMSHSANSYATPINARSSSTSMENQKFLMVCFRLMRCGLRFNIRGLETSYLFNHEVESLSQRIKTRVGSPLLYSCRFWAAHLRDTMANEYDHNVLMTELEEFFYNRFLFWLEVMSLANEVPAANISLLTVAPLTTVCGFLMAIASK